MQLTNRLIERGKARIRFRREIFKRNSRLAGAENLVDAHIRGVYVVPALATNVVAALQISLTLLTDAPIGLIGRHPQVKVALT